MTVFTLAGPGEPPHYLSSQESHFLPMSFLSAWPSRKWQVRGQMEEEAESGRDSEKEFGVQLNPFIMTLQLASCVIFSNSLYLLEFKFPHLKNKDCNFHFFRNVADFSPDPSLPARPTTLMAFLPPSPPP